MRARTHDIWTPTIRQTGLFARRRGRASMGYVSVDRDAEPRGASAPRPLPKEGVT